MAQHSDPDWPFGESDIIEAANRLAADRGLAMLVQVAERYQITVQEVRRRLKKDQAFQEDVLLWLGMFRLRRGIERDMVKQAALEASMPQLVVADGASRNFNYRRGE